MRKREAIQPRYEYVGADAVPPAAGGNALSIKRDRRRPTGVLERSEHTEGSNSVSGRSAASER